MSQYPKMLYRDGNAIDVNGIFVDTMIVAGEEQERDARLAGWRTALVQHPLDHDGDGDLGGSLPKRRGRPRKAIVPNE